MSMPLKQNHSENFIFIGNINSLNYLEKKFQIIKKNEITTKFTKQKTKIYEVVF